MNREEAWALASRLLERGIERIPKSDGIALSEPRDFFNLDPEACKHWVGRRGCILVQFQSGQVSAKTFDGMLPADGTLLDKLRDFFGW
jgi:hypothetical protein